ncbi:MAG: hypothetical protein V2I33_15200 [Kangiellaceae bacterium]|jgi:hypothetical protein|nr:hypothetical protein [Kangiellaceae bacterium]
MTEFDYLNAELGISNHDFHLDRASELKLVSFRMMSQAKRQINIFSRDLDPRILNDRSLERALTKFCRRSRFARVKILIHDPKAIQRQDHRLISLAQNLSSYVTIKAVAKDYLELPFTYYTVDDYGLMYRTVHDDYSTKINFYQPLRVKELNKQFEEIWQQSRVASEFRTLSL